MKHNTFLSFRPRLFSKGTMTLYMLALSYILFIITDISIWYGKSAFLIVAGVRFIIILGINMAIIISNTHINLVEVKIDEIDFEPIKRPVFHIKYILIDIGYIILILFLVLLLLEPFLFQSMDEYEEYHVAWLAIAGYYFYICEMKFSLIPLKSMFGYSISTDSGDYHRRVMVLQKGHKTLVSRNYFYLKALQEKNLSYQTLSPGDYYKINGLRKKAVFINCILLVMASACLFFVQDQEDFYLGIFIGLILLMALVSECYTGLLMQNENSQLEIKQGRVLLKKAEKDIRNIYINQDNVFLIDKNDEVYLVKADDELINKLREIHEKGRI